MKQNRDRRKSMHINGINFPQNYTSLEILDFIRHFFVDPVFFTVLFLVGYLMYCFFFFFFKCLSRSEEFMVIVRLLSFLTVGVGTQNYLFYLRNMSCYYLFWHYLLYNFFILLVKEAMLSFLFTLTLLKLNDNNNYRSLLTMIDSLVTDIL